MSSYLSLTGDNNYEIYAYDYQNVRLDLTLENENNSLVKVFINDKEYLSTTSNGQQTLGALNLKKGRNTIRFESEDTDVSVTSISLANLYSQGIFNGNDELSLEIESGVIPTPSYEAKNNTSSGLIVGHFSDYVSLMFTLEDEIDELRAYFLYSCYNNIDDNTFAIYVNNEHVHDGMTYNTTSWDYSTVTGFNLDNYFHQGLNTITLNSLQASKFNPDALILANKLTYDNVNPLKIECERNNGVDGRLTNSLTRVESIKGDISFTFLSESECEANYTLNYAAYSTVENAYTLVVNDTEIKNVKVIGDSNWSNYKSSDAIKIPLKKGENTIVLKYQSGGYNLDYLTISPINMNN